MKFVKLMWIQAIPLILKSRYNSFKHNEMNRQLWYTHIMEYYSQMNRLDYMYQNGFQNMLNKEASCRKIQAIWYIYMKLKTSTLFKALIYVVMM